MYRGTSTTKQTLKHLRRRCLNTDAKPTTTSSKMTATKKLQTVATEQVELPIDLQKLRQKVQSSVWVRQLISGNRTCIFTGHLLPKCLLIKGKTKLQSDRKMICIDELESHPFTTGKSFYLPMTAQGVYAAMTDVTIYKIILDLGRVRKDIVEHCTRVMRLRAISAMHRAVIEMYANRLEASALDKSGPMKTAGYMCEDRQKWVSRWDLLRKAVYARILRQDTQWQGSSPYIPIGNVQEGVARPTQVLPAGGLHCIIKMPRSKDRPLPLSVSSESSARMIWNQLSFPENSVDLTGGILDQSGNKWVSHNILGSSPQSHQEPTLGLQALASLYTHLPRLTPKETLEIADSKDPMSKRKARRLRKAAAASQGQSVSKQANAEMKSDDEEDKGASSVISGSQVLVEYWYSLQRSGDTFSKALGHAKKQVPMYCAEELFGKELSDTVISWLLLHGQASVLAKEADAASDSTYVGIAALPSTCDLALQFHRITAFVQGV